MICYANRGDGGDGGDGGDVDNYGLNVEGITIHNAINKRMICYVNHGDGGDVDHDGVNVGCYGDDDYSVDDNCGSRNIVAIVLVIVVVWLWKQYY